jgi:hypothetical protein
VLLATICTYAQAAPSEQSHSDQTTSASIAKKAESHKFFDRRNNLLSVFNATAQLGDMITTQHFRSQQPQVVRCGFGTCSTLGFHEGNPVGRPFVESGWAGHLGYTALVMSLISWAGSDSTRPITTDWSGRSLSSSSRLERTQRLLTRESGDGFS